MFTDKIGRCIEIEDDGDGPVARHNGTRVGCIEIADIDGSPKLQSMHVEVGYQRTGIAIEMMRMVADNYGKDISKPSPYAPGGKGVAGSEYYTQEGLALVRRCIALGILSDFSHDPV